MCAGGRAANPVAAVESVRDLVDTYMVVDTGIDGEVRAALERSLEGLDGQMVDAPFEGSEKSFTEALAQAKGSADWLLHMHADEVAEVFPTLGEWLSDDPSPNTDAWMVPIVNPHLVHRLPRLLRGNKEWRYVGDAHEYLEIDHSRSRALNGLTLHHHGSSDPQKFADTLERLRPAYEAGEPRATFYFAETLRDLGRTQQAIIAYRERATMGGWEEERWYAEYQAAKLSEDLESLLHCWRIRPHRHEPLTAAGRIIAARGTDDVLFVESVG
jgi:hypothetical protein